MKHDFDINNIFPDSDGDRLLIKCKACGSRFYIDVVKIAAEQECHPNEGCTINEESIRRTKSQYGE